MLLLIAGHFPNFLSKHSVDHNKKAEVGLQIYSCDSYIVIIKEKHFHNRLSKYLTDDRHSNDHKQLVFQMVI